MTFRCTAAGEERGDSLVGTASTVRSFLMVECPGPWGVDAVRDSRLPEEVKHRLAELRGTGLRPLLIRGQHHRSTRVFAASDGWVETTRLSDPHELLDLDLSRVGLGERPGLSSYDGLLYLVCTHGKHDACCAERGRPLWQAMHDVAPEETWQVSHIGGDRFAANVLVLPQGLYYGRLEPQDVRDFVAEHRAGRLDLGHLRGRSRLSFPAQAAEILLRRHLGLTAIEPLGLVAHAGDEVTFDVDGREWTVILRHEVTAPALLTCRAGVESPGWAFSLDAIR